MPIKTRVWETEDGRRFDDRGQAGRHERWLELVAMMRGLASVYCNGKEPENRAADMALFVTHHGDELQRILRATPVEGGELPAEGAAQ